MIDFNDPYVLLGLLPLLLTLAGMSLVRFFMGEGLGNTLASAALVGSFLIVILVYAGLPDWPSSGLHDKLLYLTLLSLAYGVLLDRFPALDSVNMFLKSIIPVAGVFWIFTPSGAISFSEAEFRGLALITVLALGYFLKLEKDWEDGMDVAPLLLTIAAGGMVIAWGSGGTLTGDILLAFVSAMAGYVVLNLPKRRFPLGAAGLYPSYLVILTCLLEMVMDNPGLSPAILILSLIFLTDTLTAVIPLRMPHQAKRLTTMAALLLVSLAASYV